MKNILEAVAAERTRQNEKFGEQNHNPIEWMAILTEETGEASKEAVDFYFKYPSKDDNVDFEDLQTKRLINYRTELIQVAAVAVSMVQSLERNELQHVAKLSAPSIDLFVKDVRTLKNQLNAEMVKIINFISQHGAYTSYTDASNYADIKNLEAMNIIYTYFDAEGGATGPIKCTLTITGTHLAKEL